MAREEEEINVALVEIQLRDEHSFPALGVSPDSSMGADPSVVEFGCTDGLKRVATSVETCFFSLFLFICPHMLRFSADIQSKNTAVCCCRHAVTLLVSHHRLS